MPFEPIETQEQLDQIIGNRLAQERKKYADYDDLKTAVAGFADEKKGLENQISELNAKVAAYETDSVKTKVAIETGLPFELRARLAGNTEDEIRADAESLKKLFAKPVAPLAVSEPIQTGGVASKDTALKQMLKELNIERK